MFGRKPSVADIYVKEVSSGLRPPAVGGRDNAITVTAGGCR